ncbi:putative amino acid transporter [Aureobasidium pullulans]|uniref:Amino acid transporter n=1 Tax=Aureobasidium pullulans TaxID=5580 RepID=A0AB74J4V9_AURPU|nr:putative amino acid transporter [Aureobasidium pullulans]
MEPPNYGPNQSQKHDKKYGQPPSPKISVEIGQHDINSAEDDDLVTAVKKAVNHRRLGSRQLQLTAIAGSIGASLFVAIGSGVSSGPLCLLFSFIFWATIVFSIAQCQTEIVTLFPLDGSFIRLAGRMVDPALGVTAGWNLFFAQTSFVIFEATVINTLVTYWGYDQSPAVLISVSLVLYLALNIYRADVFGEAEFWLSLCKILLATGLIVYTLVVMLGGNPLHDRFGFRYWKEPGLWTGDSPVTRLESFVNAVNVAGFVMSGPEYISMVAGEATDPRRTVPRAFNTIMSRLIVFFIGGALCVGILVPSNDSTLTNGSDTYAGASPYVISMRRLQIPVLPSIVNAALLTSIVSAGNAYTFNASRSLHAIALDGQAPAFLRRLNKNGVPYMAVITVMLFSCLAFLALGSGSSKVLSWILNFCTASQMLNWAIMSATWIRFSAAVKAQNVDRQSYLPVLSRWQPYAAYWALFWATIFLWVQGYAVFLKGNWSVATFIFNYGIIALAGGIGIVWKVVKGTRFHRSKEVDLASDCDFFDALTEHYRGEREAEGAKSSTVKGRIMSKLF